MSKTAEQGPAPVRFSKGLITWIIVGILAITTIGWLVGTYNRLISARENVDTAWSVVESDYQRRSDLVPNLVATVRGAADFEQETLTEVTEARARASQLNVNLDDPASLQQFNASQGELSSALSRLLVTVEAYPQLTATQNFRDLQAQLEGTENRISVARKDYVRVARDYSVLKNRFPNSLVANLFGFDDRAYFEAESGAEVAPTLDFNN